MPSPPRLRRLVERLLRIWELSGRVGLTPDVLRVRAGAPPPSDGGGRRRSQDPGEVAGGEVLLGRDGAREGPEEAVAVDGVVAERGEQPLHVGRGRLEAGEVDRALEAVGGELVATLLVPRERPAERGTAGEPGVDRLGEQLGVTKGVADAEREDRVLVVARVADQRPSLAVRTAIEVRQSSGPPEALGAGGVADLRGQSGRELERVQESALEVGAHRAELAAWP